MRTSTLVLTTVLLVLGARPAAAQGIDLGGSVSAIGLAGLDGGAHSPALAGPLITFRFSKKHALQVTADLDHESYGPSVPHRELMVIYTVQYRHTFPSSNPNMVTFFTVGAAGGVSWQHFDAYTYTQNGSYVQGKWVPGETKTVTVPARSDVDGIPPLVPVAGWGFERNLTPRIALRGDLSGAVGPYYVVVGRGSIGIVVRFGGSSTRKVGS